MTSSDALGVERLEVQAGRGVEVGRHRLGVGVDHHGRPALAPQRVGGLDRAVVELDPLPDPDRAAADDERGRPRHRRRLGRRPRRRVRRIEVGRLGGELRGARVDHRVARHEADGEAGRAERGTRRCRPAAARSSSPNPARFASPGASSVSASAASADREPRRRRARAPGRRTRRSRPGTTGRCR